MIVLIGVLGFALMFASFLNMRETRMRRGWQKIAIMTLRRRKSDDSSEIDRANPVDHARDH